LYRIPALADLKKKKKYLYSFSKILQMLWINETPL
jgi:hypothetical protein